MTNKKTTGHLAAILTIFLWGTTFISTKVLLQNFAPIEVLFFRFLIGYVTLWIFCPHKLKITEKKQEVIFAGAGLCGITLYFLFENIALTYTQASNVGVLVSVSPIIVALLAKVFLGENLKPKFFLGFLAAAIGTLLIGLNGNFVLKLNPLGDILAVSAAGAWACYSILTKKIGGFGYSIILSTRRTFFYGLIFMIPALSFLDFRLDSQRFLNATNLFNLFYLGFGASALCFVTWNYALRSLGAIKTSVYIYLVPGVTILAAALILKERMTWLAMIGTAFTLLGLVLSEDILSTKRWKCLPSAQEH